MSVQTAMAFNGGGAVGLVLGLKNRLDSAMFRQALIFMSCALVIAFGPYSASAATLDSECGCDGVIAAPVTAALTNLAGDDLANEIASLVSQNGALAQDVVCATRGLNAADIESVAIGLARVRLTMDQVEAWVCCSDQGLLAAFAAVTIPGDEAVTEVSGEFPRCVRAARGELTQLLTRGFSATSGGGAVSPSKP